MIDQNGQLTDEQRLRAELNDAHLVIGQQQVMLLRMQAALRECQESLQAKNQDPESKPREESSVGGST
jgi:NACalpha-BTF3-like transcription factor